MKTSIKNLFGIVFFSMILLSCSQDWKVIHGEGPIVSRNLAIESIIGFDLHGKAKIFVDQGSSQIITVKGHGNIIDRLKTNVYNDVWEIELEKGNYRDYVLEIYITVPNLEEVRMSGLGDIWIEDFIDQDALNISISGDGEVDVHQFIGLEELYTNVSGKANITFNEAIDEVNFQKISSTGDIDYHGFLVESENTDIEISGHGNISVKTMENLDVKITGAGDVFYKGHPYITSSITALGRIIDAN